MNRINTGKIKIRTLLILFVVILLTLKLHFFCLFEYPEFFSLFQGRRLYVVLGLIAIPIFLIVYHADKGKYGKQSKSVLFFFVMILFAWGVEATYSWMKYKQSLSDIISASGRLFVILYAIVFFSIFIRDKSFKKVFSLINTFITFYCCELIVMSFVYKITGKIILDFSSVLNTTGILSIRDGNLRLGITELGNIMIVYNFYKLLYENEKHKIKTIVCLLIQLYCAVFVQQTRMWLVVIAASFIFLILGKKGTLKSQFIKIAAVLGITIFLLNSQFVNSVVNSFSINGNYMYSTSARLFSIEYYSKCIKNSPIFANGFTIENNYYVSHGTYNTSPYAISANYSDVGFLGLYAETGIASICFFVIPIASMIATIKRLKKTRMYTSLDGVLVIFLLASSFTLICTDMGRTEGFALLIGYFWFRQWQINTYKNEITYIGEAENE